MSENLNLRGEHIIASTFCPGGEEAFSAVNPSDGSVLEPCFFTATESEVEQAVNSAHGAFDDFRSQSTEQRAEFLSAIAGELERLGDALISRANLETALPRQRLEGELLRTVSQVRMFSEQVRLGAYLGIRIETAEPERQPVPKAELRTVNIPLGPVAVFGASNFPLAFSVAGGDTISALAAGCPVVVKAHPAHPGTSELAGKAIMNAVKKTGTPAGVFSMLQSAGHDAGAALVRHPQIRALAFTGSQAGGRALFDLASRRHEPIPVFAEMGSVNPVIVLPAALAANNEALMEGFATSMTLGVGQFCTAPGLIVMQNSSAAESFIDGLAERLESMPEGVMLHRGIKKNFLSGVSKLMAVEGVMPVVSSAVAQSGCNVTPVLMRTTAKKFAVAPLMAEEVFGPAAMIVCCDDQQEMLAVAESLPGQLTATIHGDEQELQKFLALLRILERKAGRLIVNGYPTGVDVCQAMHHGGPYPATTDSRATSVGTEAVMRFLRPVCYQNFPRSILPEPLRDNEGVVA